MSIQFLNTVFPNPFILASSPLTETADRIQKGEAHGAGGAILKSCCSYSRKEIYDSRKVFFSSDHSRFYASSSFDREILTSEEGLTLYHKATTLCSIPIIPSVAALSLNPQDWLPLCLAFQDAGASIIQLDFFYLATFMSQPDFAQKFHNLLHTLIHSLSCEIMPKINIALPADYIFQLLSKAGVVGVSLLDSVRVPCPIAPHVPSLSFSSTSCFGAWQLPLSLHYAYIAKQHGLEICGGGGISDSESALQMISCGASLVQIASAILLCGYSKLQTFIPDTESSTPPIALPTFKKYQVDPNICICCHTCTDFSVWCDAISSEGNHAPVIENELCEGCGWCASRCPANAIRGIS